MPQEALEFERRNSLFTMVEITGQRRKGEIAIHQTVFRYKETSIPRSIIRFEDSIEKMIESCNGNTRAELQLAIPKKGHYKSKRIAQYLACLRKEISDWVQPQILWAHSRSTDRSPRKFGNTTPLPPYHVTLEFTHQITSKLHDMRENPEDERKIKKIEFLVIHLAWEYRKLPKETEEK